MAGLALDGTPVTATGVSATQVMPAFTTIGPGIICLAAEINHGTITSITTSGLTWVSRTTVNDGLVNFDLELWYAYSNLALSSAVTTVNMTSGVDFVSATQFSFKNANKTALWDTNILLPAVTQTNSTVSANTTYRETAVIGVYRSNDTSTVTQGAGFTLISGTNFMLVEYKLVTAVQTGLVVATGTIGTIGQGLTHAVAGFDYAPPFPPRYQANLRI